MKKILGILLIVFVLAGGTAVSVAIAAKDQSPDKGYGPPPITATPTATPTLTLTPTQTPTQTPTLVVTDPPVIKTTEVPPPVIAQVEITSTPIVTPKANGGGVEDLMTDNLLYTGKMKIGNKTIPIVDLDISSGIFQSPVGTIGLYKDGEGASAFICHINYLDASGKVRQDVCSAIAYVARGDSIMINDQPYVVKSIRIVKAESWWETAQKYSVSITTCKAGTWDKALKQYTERIVLELKPK
jgi:hypothetical protein